MESIYIALVALLVSAYVASSPSMDPRTQAFVIATLLVVVALTIKTAPMWVFIYIALALISSLVVAYWVRNGILHFKPPVAHEILPVPLWLPVFFALGYLAVHQFYGFVVLEDD
jgi:hypothetical protein